MVIFVPTLLVIYTNGATSDFTSTKFLRTLVSIASVILIAEGSRYIIYNSRKWIIPTKRIWLVLGVGITWCTVILYLSTLSRYYIGTGTLNTSRMVDSNIVINNSKLVLGLWGYGFLNSLINFPLLLVAYDLFYHYAKLRHTEEEKEKLEKQKLKAELQQLKGIVNPHFLFNNLNSLSSLIMENPVHAQDFLDELTKVFRYLLKNNETELVPLSQELSFIRSYYHLLQTRYGTGIQMDAEMESRYNTLRIPPLTLQLLVENAVKHNRIQKDQPLLIEMFAAPGNKLVVRNNIIRKESSVESTGIGLQQINARYRMLKHDAPVIEKDDQHFSVIIPLVEAE